MGGARRQRRDLRNLLPYGDQMISYPATQGRGGVDDLYFQSDDWRGRGLDQALQRLVERDQRREQEEEQRAGCTVICYLLFVTVIILIAQSHVHSLPGSSAPPTE